MTEPLDAWREADLTPARARAVQEQLAPRVVTVNHVGTIRYVAGAKSRFVGDYEPPANERGRWAILWHRGEAVGSVLRTRAGVRPVFVSPGHRVDQATARDIALACAPRYRLPEPIRCADRLAAAQD